MVNQEKRENDFTSTYALIYKGTVLNIQIAKNTFTMSRKPIHLQSQTKPQIHVNIHPQIH